MRNLSIGFKTSPDWMPGVTIPSRLKAWEQNRLIRMPASGLIIVYAMGLYARNDFWA